MELFDAADFEAAFFLGCAFFFLEDGADEDTADDGFFVGVFAFFFGGGDDLGATVTAWTCGDYYARGVCSDGAVVNLEPYAARWAPTASASTILGAADYGQLLGAASECCVCGGGSAFQ